MHQFGYALSSAIFRQPGINYLLDQLEIGVIIYRYLPFLHV